MDFQGVFAVDLMGRVKRLCGWTFVGLYALLFALLLVMPQQAMAWFAAETIGDYDNVTVMEVDGVYDVAYDQFGSVDMSARRTIAKEFYRTHGDDYDFLVIFTNFDFAMPPGAKAFFSPARNDVQGIGLLLNDYTRSYSYDGSYLDRLEGTIDMANISSHVLEPTDPEFDDTLLVISHEMAHRWSAYIQFDDNGTDSNALLGLDDAHWSFLLDSGGSTLYGNNWQDNGDGTFTSIQPEQGRDNKPIGRIFSPLDLYLMGLIDKSQVPPMTLIDSPGMPRDRIPEIGVTITGMAKTVTIDDIIVSEGERLPSAADTRKEFRMAFIYAVDVDSNWLISNPQNLGELAAINRLQTEWVKRFSILTDGAGKVEASFVDEETVDTNPGVTDPSTTAHVAPHVNEGVNWLVNNQQGDGSWQDQQGTAQRDTAAAVAALKQFPAGAASATSGQSWLGGVTSVNNDFLARKLLGLSSADLTEIEALQNIDGGWGSAPGYRSDPVDTALLLQALTTHGSTNTIVIDAAINHLHNTQNPDGGWNTGFGSSLVQPTAYALLALNDYRDNPNYTLEATIADGLAWLAAKQNGDGGFGNSPSTVYDTAIALSALKVTGGNHAGTSSAVNYLLNRQANSGSWNHSAFQTAMVVEALYAAQVAVDLALQTADITFNPTSIEVVPADVTVSASIHNFGSDAATQVKVSLYMGDPVPENLLDEQFVDLPGNSTVTVNFVTMVIESGLQSYSVVLDRDNQVTEVNEYNNSASNTLAVNMELPTVLLLAPVGLQTVTTPLLDYTVEGAETVEAQVDGVVISQTAGQNLDSLSEGNHTVTVTATNADGLSVSATGSFVVDMTPPQVVIRYPYQDGVVEEATPLLLYDLSEVGAVSVTVDGIPVAKTSGQNLNPLADGEHLLRVVLTDSNGVSSFDEISFVVYSGAEEPFETRLTVSSNARKAAIAFDDHGNIYIAGHNTDYDIFVRKYTYYGELLWSSTYATSGSEWVEGLVVDSEGSAYVAGYTVQDCIVVKFDTSGNRVWVNQFGTTSTDEAYGIAIDEKDNIVVSGLTGGSLFSYSNGSWGFFVAKLNRETGDFYWGNQFASGTTDQFAYLDSGEVCFDAAGNIYLAGNTEVNGNSDYLLWKMDADGTYQWSYMSSNPADEEVYGLGVDAFGNVVLTGNIFSSSTNIRFAAKLDSTGTLLWQKSFGSTSYYNYADVVVEGDGDFYLSGGGFNLIKIDKDGNQLWSVDPPGLGDTYDIAMDQYRNIYLIGGYSNSIASFHRLGDPRNPIVDFDDRTLWVAGGTADVEGTASGDASVKVGFHHKTLVSDAVFTESGRWRASLSGFVDGDNFITAVAKNASGFKDWAHAKVLVDTVVPVVSIELPVNGASFTTKPVLNYSFSEGEVTVYVNGVATYKQSGATIDALTPGMNRVRVEAEDLAGNIGFDEIILYAQEAAVGELIMSLDEQTQTGSAGRETVTDIVSDQVGNIYVFGYTTGSFPGYANAGNKDRFVSKYDVSGRHLLTWQFGQPEDESGGGIAVDEAGNIYLAWTAYYTNLKGKTSTDYAAYVAKIDTSGALLWQQEYNSWSTDRVHDITLDHAGNIYIAGQTYAGLEKERYGGGGDYFVSKLSNDGSKVWTSLSNEPSVEYLNAIEVDAAGNLYATGYAGASLSGVAFPDHLCLLRFDPDGVLDLIEPVPSPANNFKGLAIDIDTSGNIVVAGQSLTYEYLIAKYATSGSHLWSAASSSDANIYFAGVATDNLGNVFVSGYSSDSFDGNLVLGGYDVILAKHAPTGQKLWSVQYGSSANDYAAGITLASDGSLFIGGYTYGQLGDESYGSSDIFLSRFATATLPIGPELTIDPFSGSINITQANFSGTVSTGAEINVSVTAPVGSSAFVSLDIPNPDGTWSFNVSNMVENADNVLLITAADAVGVTNQTVTITVDTLPPGLTVDAVDTSISQSFQVITGTAESGVTLTVKVNPPSTPQTVVISNGIWSYQANLSAGDNDIVFIATDATGNNSVQSVTITCTPPPELTVALSRASIDRDEATDVVMTLSNVQSGTDVLVEELIDVNANGVADVGEPVIRRFKLRDGVSLPDPNIQSDEDGVEDGSIVTTLNYQFINDVYHAPGDHLFRLSDGMFVIETQFNVTQTSSQQTIQGFVLDDQSNVVPGAVLQVMNKWGRTLGYAYSDEGGSSALSVPEPGEFIVVPYAAGYVIDKNTNPIINVGSGEAVSQNLHLIAIANQISGTVKDQQTSFGIPGVLIRAENDRYMGTALSDFSGVYDLSLPDGNYELYADTFTADGPSAQKYLGSFAPVLNVAVSGDSIGNDIDLPHSQMLSRGKVLDQFLTGIPGIPVRGLLDDGSGMVAHAVTDAQGDYALALMSYDSWEVSVLDDAAQALGYVGNRPDPVAAASGSYNIGDLTLYPIDAWVTGTVTDNDNQPVAGLAVELSNAAMGIVVEGQTTVDGTYRLGVHNSDWIVSLSAESLGYEPVLPVQTSVATGQASVVDFMVSLLPQQVNTLVITAAKYTVRKNTLTVDATSDYPDAAPMIEYLGATVAMNYEKLFKGKYIWSYTDTNVVTAPATVTVSGPEGNVTMPVTVK